MLKPEEVQGAQPTVAQLMGQQTPGPTTTEGGVGVTFKKTWSASLIFKILVVGAGVLLLLFFILTIVFGAKSNCTSYKDDVNTKQKLGILRRNYFLLLVNSTNSTLNQLKKDLVVCNEKQSACNTKSGTCSSSLDKCKTEATACQKSLEKANQELTTCKTERTQCNDELEACKKESTDLQTQITQKDQELAHWKAEVQKVNSSVVNETKKLTIFRWVSIGEGAAILAATIDVIIQHVKNGNLNQQITTKNTEIAECKKKLEPLEKEVTAAKAEIEKAKGDIEHCNELKENCAHEIIQERLITDQLRKEIESLQAQVEPIPKLAVDQAKLQFLQQVTNTEVNAFLLHNGTEQGYHKADLYAHLGTSRPLVFIIRTDTGYVFGAGMNISWPRTQNVYFEDHGAYTFSTTKDKVCKVKDPLKAIYNTDDNFFQFGGREIMVDKSDVKHPSGEAESDTSYDCGSKEPEKFYHDGKFFTVKELLIYRIEITQKKQRIN